MKIVILDGFTTNPGDISWERIQALGDTVIYDRTPVDDVVARAKEADLLLVNDITLDRTILEQLPKLKYIGVLATGYNIIDIKATNELGICVTNIPAYGTNSVAQSTMALLLELCHRTGAHSDAVRSGEWTKALDYCFWNYPLVELYGKTMGIIGYGRIGKTVANMAKAFGMKILVATSDMAMASDEEGIQFCSRDELLKQADVVSIHCPLTEETAGIINKETLALMKPNAFLLNVARGAIVVEADLAAALNSGRIAGAGVDVLSSEPPKADNPLLGAKNCIITPHIAWAPVESRIRLVDLAVDNLEHYLKGSPINVVTR